MHDSDITTSIATSDSDDWDINDGFRDAPVLVEGGHQRAGKTPRSRRPDGAAEPERQHERNSSTSPEQALANSIRERDAALKDLQGEQQRLSHGDSVGGGAISTFMEGIIKKAAWHK